MLMIFHETKSGRYTEALFQFLGGYRIQNGPWFGSPCNKTVYVLHKYIFSKWNRYHFGELKQEGARRGAANKQLTCSSGAGALG